MKLSEQIAEARQRTEENVNHHTRRFEECFDSGQVKRAAIHRKLSFVFAAVSLKLEEAILILETPIDGINKDGNIVKV